MSFFIIELLLNNASGGPPDEVETFHDTRWTLALCSLLFQQTISFKIMHFVFFIITVLIVQ